MGFIKAYCTSHPWVAGTLVIALLGSGWWYYGTKSKQTNADFVLVKRGAVSQTVSVTGKVKSAQEVKLSFEKGGRVASAYRGVGDRVEIGALLVSLENGDIAAQLAQAKATAKA